MRKPWSGETANCAGPRVPASAFRVRSNFWSDRLLPSPGSGQTLRKAPMNWDGTLFSGEIPVCRGRRPAGLDRPGILHPTLRRTMAFRRNLTFPRKLLRTDLQGRDAPLGPSGRGQLWPSATARPAARRAAGGASPVPARFGLAPYRETAVLELDQRPLCAKVGGPVSVRIPPWESPTIRPTLAFFFQNGGVLPFRVASRAPGD